MEQETREQQLVSLLQGYRDLVAFGRVTPILGDGHVANVDWFVEREALEVRSQELLEQSEAD